MQLTPPGSHHADVDIFGGRLIRPMGIAFFRIMPGSHLVGLGLRSHLTPPISYDPIKLKDQARIPSHKSYISDESEPDPI